MQIVYNPKFRQTAVELAAKAGMPAVRAVAGTRYGDDSIPWGWSIGAARVNNGASVRISSCKGTARRVMHDAGVSVPQPWDGAEPVPYPMVCRPHTHAMGRHLYVIHNARELADCPIRFSDGYYARLVEKSAEYRVHVAHDRVLAVQDKHYNPASGVVQANQAVTGESWRILRWGEVVQHGPVHKVMIEAVKAVRCLALDFGGVDVSLDTRGMPFVMEVNTAPSVAGSALMVMKYANYFRMIAEDRLPTRDIDTNHPRKMFFKGLIDE